MAQTFVRMLVHLVFSTKHRKDLILPDIEASLHAYMTGTLKNLGCSCLIVNGTANHVHTLFAQQEPGAQ